MVCTFFVITWTFFSCRYNFFNYDRYSDHPHNICYQTRSAPVFYQDHPLVCSCKNCRWIAKIKKFSTKLLSTKLL